MRTFAALLFAVLFSACFAQHGEEDIARMKQLLDEADLKHPNDTVAKRFTDMEQHRLTKPLAEVDDPAVLEALKQHSNTTVGPFPSLGHTCALVRIVERRKTTRARVSYIYLDKKSGTDEALQARADSIRAAVQQGWPFADAASKYSMDGNSLRGGDLGWFDTSSMVKEFSDAVVKHHQGDLFTLRVPIYGWYVVLVTGEPGPQEYVQYLIARGPICP